MIFHFKTIINYTKLSIMVIILSLLIFPVSSYAAGIEGPEALSIFTGDAGICPYCGAHQVGYFVIGNEEHPHAWETYIRTINENGEIINASALPGTFPADADIIATVEPKSRLFYTGESLIGHPYMIINGEEANFAPNFCMDNFTYYIGIKCKACEESGVKAISVTGQSSHIYSQTATKNSAKDVLDTTGLNVLLPDMNIIIPDNLMTTLRPVNITRPGIYPIICTDEYDYYAGHPCANSSICKAIAWERMHHDPQNHVDVDHNMICDECGTTLIKLATPTVISLKNTTQDSIEIIPLNAPHGSSALYSLNDGEWQVATKWTGLKAATTYYIKAKYIAPDLSEYIDSDISTGKSFKTSNATIKTDTTIKTTVPKKTISTSKINGISGTVTKPNVAKVTIPNSNIKKTSSINQSTYNSEINISKNKSAKNQEAKNLGDPVSEQIINHNQSLKEPNNANIKTKVKQITNSQDNNTVSPIITIIILISLAGTITLGVFAIFKLRKKII